MLAIFAARTAVKSTLGCVRWPNCGGSGAEALGFAAKPLILMGAYGLPYCRLDAKD
ncbi:hypothetical protein RLEG3_29445 [Rhizobium leguminosarum bv. trifolii WSM1689]|nr:hypothetical protein RLEG3_29445 [Rhizobium leguminosarum bv. trifolii WSM1689]